MSIYFEETGNKTAPAIVFVHGGGMSGWMWEKQLEYFKEYHCLVPDLPGHGKSAGEGRISIRDSADEVANLIERYVEGGKANLVGHSLGAKVAVELLGRRPELVDHAVIASALFRPVPLMKLAHRHSIYKLTELMLKPKWMAALMAGQFKFPDDYCHSACMRDLQSLDEASLYGIYDELYRNITLPGGLNNAAVPALIVAGDRELKAMRESVADLSKAMPKGEGILIKKGLHTYPWTMHELFNKTIDNWINDRNIDNNAIIRIPEI